MVGEGCCGAKRLQRIGGSRPQEHPQEPKPGGFQVWLSRGSEARPCGNNGDNAGPCGSFPCPPHPPNPRRPEGLGAGPTVSVRDGYRKGPCVVTRIRIAVDEKRDLARRGRNEGFGNHRLAAVADQSSVGTCPAIIDASTFVDRLVIALRRRDSTRACAAECPVKTHHTADSIEADGRVPRNRHRDRVSDVIRTGYLDRDRLFL